MCLSAHTAKNSKLVSVGEEGDRVQTSAWLGLCSLHKHLSSNDPVPDPVPGPREMAADKAEIPDSVGRQALSGWDRQFILYIRRWKNKAVVGEGRGGGTWGLGAGESWGEASL